MANMTLMMENTIREQSGIRAADSKIVLSKIKICNYFQRSVDTQVSVKNAAN